MSNELRLLKAFIEAAGYDIEEDEAYDMCHYKVTKRPVKKRTAKDNAYTSDYLDAWSHYPIKQGNKKLQGFIAWGKNLEGTPNLDFQVIKAMIEGTIRYEKYCNHNNTEEKYINQASTFYGPEKLYLESWTVEAKKIALPKYDIQLCSFAKEHNLSSPPTGMDYLEYRRQLENELRG